MANAVGKKIFEAEKAYLAGFLDADGAIMAIIEKHQEKKFGWRIRLVVKITQNEPSILNYFLKKYKIGSVVKNRTTFDWLIRDQHSIVDLLKKTKPYLKIKNRQAQIALKILSAKIKSKKDLIKIAYLADSLSRLNVRSRNRRLNFASMI